MATKMHPLSGDFRATDRLARVVRQRKGPDRLLVGVLAVAFVLGILGFALPVLWVVALIVMALGLGFAVANSRRDRYDAEQLAEDEAGGASPQRYRVGSGA